MGKNGKSTGRNSKSPSRRERTVVMMLRSKEMVKTERQMPMMTIVREIRLGYSSSSLSEACSLSRRSATCDSLGRTAGCDSNRKDSVAVDRPVSGRLSLSRNWRPKRSCSLLSGYGPGLVVSCLGGLLIVAVVGRGQLERQNAEEKASRVIVLSRES